MDSEANSPPKLIICGDVKHLTGVPFSNVQITIATKDPETAELIKLVECYAHEDGGFREVLTDEFYPDLSSLCTDDLYVSLAYKNKSVQVHSAKMLSMFRRDKYVELLAKPLEAQEEISERNVHHEKIILVEDPAIISSLVYSSDAWKHYNRLETFSLNFLVLKKNYDSLIALLETARSDKGIEEIFIKGSEKEIDLILHELIRRLHNFLASCTMFEETSQKLVEEWLRGTPIRGIISSEFNERVTAKLVSHFIRQLRHYTLHERLPFTSVTYSFGVMESDKGTKIDASFHISSVDLLAWKQWKSKSRKYIEAQDQELEIESFSREYFSLARDFHQWLHSELKNYFADEFAWLEDMAQRVRRGLGRDE